MGGEVVIPEIPTLEGMLKETLQKGRSVWDRHGSLLLAGTVGFFSILAFACSYYIIHRSLFAGYGVMKDVGTVEQEIVGKPCECGALDEWSSGGGTESSPRGIHSPIGFFGPCEPLGMALSRWMSMAVHQLSKGRGP